MIMNEYATLLTTINAPYAEYMDAQTLAVCLNNGEITSGQINSFFTEVPVDKQITFAENNDITLEKLTETAQSFSKWSGQDVALVA